MKNTTKIGIILSISIVFFAAEIAVGFKTRSLALIADAFHYLNDIVAYAIAFAAAYFQERGQNTDSFTYAFQRAELVGGFFNGVFLLALALSIFLQSLERFVNVEVVDSPKLVLIIGCIGLGLNVFSALVVHDHGGHSATPIPNDPMELTTNTQIDFVHAKHNHKIDPPVEAPQHNIGLAAVLVHLLGDAVNNIGVIAAAIIFMKVHSPKRFYADPAVSLAISIIIFGGAIPTTLKAGRILLEASPVHLDLSKVKEDLLSIPEVLSVHDLHVWHLSQSFILASLHVRVAPGTSIDQWEKTEQILQHCFEEYGINHVTISPEIQSGCRLPSPDEFGCASVSTVKRRGVAATSAA